MNDTVQHDLIHRFTLADDRIRGEVVTLQHSYSEAADHQNLPLPIQLLLGEFLAASALLAEVLKFSGTLTLQVRGDGQVPLLVAEATSERTLRGVASLRQNVARGDVIATEFDKLVGQGVLTLTVDPTEGQRYQGIVPIEGSSIAECLSHYFTQSEQLPTKLWLSASPTLSAGLLLQQLPAKDATESAKDLWDTADQLARTQNLEEWTALPHATVLYRLFHELEVKLFPGHPVRFACGCSEQRSANALMAVGKQDALALVEERGSIEMDCHFCGAQYRFYERDIRALFGDNSLEH